ncbi:hypothetical protein GM3708_2181 [Geminocystis sp. NIES-3708]|uniref:glycosyltransferase n=1 Tax=Geminocystis sp. NIES-3708 TaxID=1615909 RepID=UPI0005FCB646|nr:glycosyltransferase [Geminocystis sp. NIES-3708]BAQ61775.1 hypothetical protein GM3708_2181 [Geminocystis sp. NIES-3708]
MPSLIVPKMSVILPTPDKYHTIAKTLDYLRQQTVKKNLEIIIVAPSASEITPHIKEIDDFFAIEAIGIGKIKSIAFAYTEGIRHSQAPIVALAEDHCFPDADWAEYLIEAHKQPWAVVGPVLRNANPNNVVSWADMLIAYAPWLDFTPSGIVNFLPGHNSSYKKDILLSYEEKLAEMMETETILHWDIQSKGYQLYLESRAKTSHTNFGDLFTWIQVQFYCGKLFAGDRVNNQNWNMGKKLIYTMASPLIPFVRLWRIYRQLEERKLQKLWSLKLFLTLFLGLIIDSIGQGIGYIFGVGKAMAKISKFEFHRDQYS